MIRRTVLFAAITLLTVSFSNAQPKGSPVTVHGALQISNGRIVNKNGQPPQLRGISLSWSLWAGKKYYNPAAVDWLVKDFKISLLRVAMGVQPAGGYLQQSDEQKKLVTTVTDAAIKQGIYVLIDWHDHNSNLHTGEAKKFFAEMAQRYAGVPNVIYEIWNEPERVNWDTCKAYALQVIPEIRRYDKKNLIIVGSPHWDQDVDIVAADRIAGFDNIAYSFHFYASDKNHQSQLRNRADKALAAKLPLMITEWGVGEANGNGQFSRSKTKLWTDWMDHNKLSWANWNLTDKDETTALLEPGAPANGGWTNEQLTYAGQHIRDVLRKLNK